MLSNNDYNNLQIPGTSSKLWFAISPKDQLKLETYLKALHPELWTYCPNLMGHRTLMTLPEIFQKIDINVYTGEQTIGSYVLTWPGAYHFGGNLGLNYAEVMF